MDDAGSHFGELDGHDVDRLDQELSVVGGLVEIRLLCLLQLLLEEQGDLFHVSTGSHAQDDANCLSPDLHVSTGQDLKDVHDKAI